MSLSWSTAQLGVLVPGDEPVSLRYGDTHPGRSDAEPYTTIIAFHGTGFNSIIWSPWLEHLPANVRLIAANRRGYFGSSPVHESQQLLPNNPEAFGRYVVDTLAFIKFAVDVLKVEGVRVLDWDSGDFVDFGTSRLVPCSFVDH
ncbi:hypothetical protein CALVIDRAFT_566110 [Calocera viscosa TUFC12733]|uniref:AB hydrolase-1 domain-containing protein n=1 Tax=Calocera viscosa (strain TUFC12733) TaxID=1330018 RepID=A0A167JT81_CALVF|nr:hypothetical protein CALVIDRAFT_566110 [Calocera viscosa TUFC12733]